MTSTTRFNYGAAKRAGYTDEQIAAHLAAKRAAGVNVVVDRAEVEAVRAGVPISSAPAARPAVAEAPENPFTAALGNFAIESLPAAGAIVGSTVGSLGGPPGRIGGAAAGGSFGEGVREIMRGKPLSPKDIAKAGAEQGAYEVAGGLIVSGASKAARGLMRGALGVGKPIAGEIKVGKNLFKRDPVPDALLEGVGAGEGGALKARVLRKGAGGDIGSLLRTEKQAGREFSTREVTKYAREMLLDESLENDEKAKVFNYLVKFYREKGSRIDPELLQRIKRRAGGKFKGFGKKGVDPLTDATMRDMAGEIERGAGEALNQIPGMGALNARYGRLKNLQEFVETAASRKDPTWEIQKPGTLPILRGIVSNRAVNSNIAIKLADPAWQNLYRQSPRLFFALIGASDEPDVTAQ